MKLIEESCKNDILANTIGNKNNKFTSGVKLLTDEDAIGVLIMSMDDINEIIRRTNAQDSVAWFLLSEVEKQNCAKRLMRNVFDGVKDQIEYAIADNFGIQMTLSTPTMS